MKVYLRVEITKMIFFRYKAKKVLFKYNLSFIVLGDKIEKNLKKKKTKSPNNFLKCAYNSKNIFPTKKILQYVFIYTIQAIDWYTIHLIIYIKSCPPEMSSSMSSMSSRNVLQLSSKSTFGGQLEDIWRTMAALKSILVFGKQVIF